MNTNRLPFTRNLSLAYNLSLVVAFLMAIASLAGVFFQSAIYPTEELRDSFVSNDVVNLLVGLPILLGSMVLTRRGKLIGLLLWPGALFYVNYNYIAYAVAMLFTLPFIFFLALVVLSVYTMIGLLLGMDSASIQKLLEGAVSERFAGGVLIGFGVLFFLRGVGQAVSVATGQVSYTSPETGVLVADLLVTPFWIIGGILLWRRQVFGYTAGAGLLFQSSMLFIGLLVFFILQPIVAGIPFPVEDFAVIFVMGLVFFIPFALFVRGVLSDDRV